MKKVHKGKRISPPGKSYIGKSISEYKKRIKAKKG